MQEVFVETLVAKKPTKKDALLRGAVVVGMLVLGAPSYIMASFNLYFTVIGAVVCAGLLYCIYYFWTALNLEFEYILTGSEMDVDRISAHRSRKHLLTVDCKDIAAMGRYQTGLEGDRKPLFYCADPQEGAWYFVTQEGQMVVFTPAAKLLEGMRVSLPRQVVNEVFIKGRNLL